MTIFGVFHFYLPKQFPKKFFFPKKHLIGTFGSLEPLALWKGLGEVRSPFRSAEFSWNLPQGAQKINAQTSQELRTNFLVTTYKLPEIPGSLYVRTNLLKFQEACTYTYKLTKISVSLYVRTNLLNVQTYSNIYNIHVMEETER